MSPKIRSVILASPDIDVDVFERQVLELGDNRSRITILFAKRSGAQSIHLDRARCAAPRCYRFSAIRKSASQYGITVIDASDAKQGDVLRHSTFSENADILRSLGNTFHGGTKTAAPVLMPASAPFGPAKATP
ncbi:alpha/beta hydrolase [Mesorhizobium caraganae]